MRQTCPAAALSCALLASLIVSRAGAQEWNPPFPRITYLWGGYEAARGPAFYAQYDQFIAYNDFVLPPSVNAQMRALNSDIVILLSSIMTYGDPLMVDWQSAQPGDPEYNYLCRNTQGQVMMVYEWNHPMFNMANPACVAAVRDWVVNEYTTARQPYDGLFFDRIHDTISWIGSDLDIDQDGYAESASLVNRLYREGVIDFMTGLRAALGQDLLICGNDAPLVYTDYVNGREYEYQLQIIMDHGTWIDWPWLANDYMSMVRDCRQPPLTFLCTNPPRTHREKYWLDVRWGMPAAMQETCSRYFRRMRFGITTALLADGMACTEYGDTWHGNPWWYDEFDNAGQGKGYLGHPVGTPFPVTATPEGTPVPEHTPEPHEPRGVQRRDFENGLILVNGTRNWQHVDLEAPFRRIDGQQAPREMWILDDEPANLDFTASPGFTMQQATYEEWYREYHRAAAGSGIESATWAFEVRHAGEFQFWVWRAANPQRTSAAKFRIPHASGIAETLVDQSQGPSVWIPLGTHPLETGWNHVILTDEAPGGIVVADCVKIESVARYNDGAEVQQVELGPWDGIVLLGAPPTKTPTLTPTPTSTPMLGEILNPGFENGVTPWIRTTGHGDTRGASAGIVQKEGYWMFGFVDFFTGPHHDTVYQYVPTTPGEWYELRYWGVTKQTGGTDTDARVRCFLDPWGNRQFDEATGSPWSSTGGVWQEFTRYAQAQPDRMTVAFRLETLRNLNLGAVFVDLTSLAAVGPQPTYTFTPTRTPSATATGTPTATASPTLTSTPFEDWDGDGIPDSLEGGKNPGDGRSNRYLRDSDGDGLEDGLEDANRDGFSSPEETLTRSADTDGDGYEDGIETLVVAGDPLSANSPSSALEDLDRDILPDASDPFPDDPDGDGDRYLDGYEAAAAGVEAVSHAHVHPALGDAVPNGLLDNGDAQMILNFFANNPVTTFDSSRSDLDRNGIIDNGDAQKSLNFFAHVQPHLPVQHTP